MCSGVGDRTCLLPGFPIRKSSDQCSVDSSPRLIAASYVLLRLLVPRHPPCALISLATTKDARVHCAVLKVRAVPLASFTAGCVRASVRYGEREVLPCRSAERRTAGASNGPRRRHHDESWVRPLRTQQRARSPATDTAAFHSCKQDVLAAAADATNANSQCSTHELDAGRARADALALIACAGCSLERR